MVGRGGREGGAGFCQFRFWARTWHRLSGHAEAVSHIGQPEALTTRIYNFVLGGFEEKKKKRRKRRLATEVSSGANLRKIKRISRKIA